MLVHLKPGCTTRLAHVAGDGVLTIAAFARLRGELSGRPQTMDALDALCTTEPGFERRLATRILPSVLRRAALPMPSDLTPHPPRTAARTVVERSVAASWVAQMLLGTIEQPPPELPEVDCGRLLASTKPWECAKLRCLLEYFDRIADAAPAGRLEIERVVLPARSAEAWEADRSPLTPLEVSGEGAIEDAAAHRQVDFANQYLGGGVLSGGCVQEEIRFSVAPELLVGMLICPRMQPDEAIILRGAEQFARTSGYARTLAYAGPFNDPCARAADGTPGVEVVAIDAIDYRRMDSSAQYRPAAILRELGKARSGFRQDERALPVATGNWGCGAFGGDPQLKAVIQWIAASAERRSVRYFSYGDVRVRDLAGFAAAARERFASVGALFGRLLAVAGTGGGDLHRRLLAATDFVTDE